MSALRIVHLTPHLPYAPGGHGGATRQFHLLRRLVELGHEVTVVVPVPPAERELVALPRAAGIETVAHERPPSRVAETLRTLATAPALVPLAASAPLHAWQLRVLWEPLRAPALAAIARVRPDLVTLEHDVTAGWIADLPPDLPTLLTLHNVTSDYYAARAAAAAGAQRAWFALEARRARAYARRWLPRHATLVTVSDADAGSLRRLLPGVAPTTIPNGVDLASFPAVAADPPQPPSLLFTGTMNYPPNAEGIRWFAEEVWPAVRRARPDARLAVVGREPAEPVRRLAELPGIEVTGAVPDVAPWFAGAHVVVVPLLSGGGTRLKILEAAASGRAIVSTRRGAEGLDVRHGRELALADDADAFARELLALLDDPARRAALGAGARALAERHDWRALGDELDRVARATAAGGRAGAQRPSSSA